MNRLIKNKGNVPFVPMTARSLYLLNMLIISLLITACEKSSELQPSIGTQPASNILADSAVVGGQIGERTKMQAEIFAAFQKEISVCISAMKILKADRAFVDAFTSQEKRQAKPLEDFLRTSTFAGTEEVQYILSNLKYFVIDVNFHGDAGAVAWVQNEPIYCAPSLRRLEEIEGLGESQEAWSIREHFLDRELANLSSPSEEASYDPLQFESFKLPVKKVSQFYSSMQRPKFIAWIQKAIESVESQRRDLQEGAGGQSVAQQNKIIDGEVSFLRSFLEQSGGT